MASKDDDSQKKDSKNGVAPSGDVSKPGVQAAKGSDDKKPDDKKADGGPAKSQPETKTAAQTPKAEQKDAKVDKPAATRGEANDNKNKPSESKAKPAATPAGSPNGSRSAKSEPPGHVPVVPPKAEKQGSFMSTMAIALIGGVIGALIVGGFSGSGSDGDAITAFEGRIKALEGKAPEIEKAVTDQKAALAALKGEPAEGADKVASLAALSAKVADIGPQGDALAALQSERKRLAQDVSRVGADVIALKASVAKDAGAREALDGQVKGLVTRLATIEKQLVELAARDSSALRHADLSIALANLRQVVDRGGSYRGELDALKALAPADADLSVLEANAEKGVATPAALSQSLRQASLDALDAEANAKSEGVVDRILANARSLVKVRRTVPGEGDDTSNLLARVSQAIEAGDLKAAVESGGKVQGEAAKALGPWLASAKARLSVEQGLRALQGDLVGSVSEAKAR